MRAPVCVLTRVKSLRPLLVEAACLTSWLGDFLREVFVRDGSVARGTPHRLALECLEDRCVPAYEEFTVTNTSDEDVAGSLRRAIKDANLNKNDPTKPDLIKFAIAGANKVITAKSPLIVWDPVKIDGTKQAGIDITSGIVNAQPDATNALLVFTVGRRGAENVNASKSEVYGLMFSGHNAGDGILVNGVDECIIGGSGANQVNRFISNKNGVHLLNSKGTIIIGNRIGTDLGSNINMGNVKNGVFVEGGSGNKIGVRGAARNIISGNSENGVEVKDSQKNVITNNYIGLKANGSESLPNSKNGVYVHGSSDNTVIGSTVVLKDNVIVTPANVISGNKEAGVCIEGDKAFASKILGNYIGPDATGAKEIKRPDGGWSNSSGIKLLSSQDIVVGGDTPDCRNVVSGNQHHNIHIGKKADALPSDNTKIVNNYIGPDTSGLKKVCVHGVNSRIPSCQVVCEG